MKAYLIDPTVTGQSAVSEIDFSGSWKDISPTIGDHCRAFDVVRLYHVDDYDFIDDHVYVDDEGLYSVDDQYFWMHKNYPLPLAGRGLLLGGDPDGDTVDVKTDIETVRNDIRIIGDRFNVQMMTAFSKAADMPSPDGYMEDYRPFVWKHHEALA